MNHCSSNIDARGFRIALNFPTNMSNICIAHHYIQTMATAICMLMAHAFKSLEYTHMVIKRRSEKIAAEQFRPSTLDIFSYNQLIRYGNILAILIACVELVCVCVCTLCSSFDGHIIVIIISCVYILLGTDCRIVSNL